MIQVSIYEKEKGDVHQLIKSVRINLKDNLKNQLLQQNLL